MRNKLVAYFAAFMAGLTGFDRDAAERHLRFKAAQTSTVIQAVVVVVVASVGVIIVDNIDSSLGDPGNTGLSESQEGLLTGFGSMIDLIEPLLIVLIAVVLIAVVQRIRQ